MTSYEIMLSESQERMLLVADKGREDEVLRVFAKWGLDAVDRRQVTADDTMRVRHHGELVAEIPNKALTDDAPLYHRPVGTWKAPVPLDPPAGVLEELKKPRDYTADLKKLLASREHLRQALGLRAVRLHGADQHRAGPRRRSRRDAHQRARDSKRMSAELARWRSPATAAGAISIPSSARCTPSPKPPARSPAPEPLPVAATNCLNFGNPEKPEIMAQLSAAIDGIAEACTALGTPITGGNVSLYNETHGEGIYPTPVIGIVGILDDVTKAVPSGFQRPATLILLLSAVIDGLAGSTRQHLARSELCARAILRRSWGSAAVDSILPKKPRCNRCLDRTRRARLASLRATTSPMAASRSRSLKRLFANGVGANDLALTIEG